MAEDKIVAVNDANFEEEVIKSNIPVLVDFWAPWCGACQTASPIIDKVAGEYEGKVKVCKLNVDEGRETAARVAGGAIAKLILQRFNIDIYAFTRSIGDIFAQTINRLEIERNIVRSPDPEAAQKMIDLVNRVKEEKDSIGGIVDLRINGLPPGLGDPVFNKFEAAMAYAIMGLGAVRGVEVGDGFGITNLTGSQNNDAFVKKENKIGTRTNHCGGVLGGITTGEEFILRAAVKPPASIGKEQETVTTQGESTTIKVEGRHDPTIVPRIVPVVEAMAAIVTVDFLLKQKSIEAFKKTPGE